MEHLERLAWVYSAQITEAIAPNPGIELRQVYNFSVKTEGCAVVFAATLGFRGEGRNRSSTTATRSKRMLRSKIEAFRKWLEKTAPIYLAGIAS